MPPPRFRGYIQKFAALLGGNGLARTGAFLLARIRGDLAPRRMRVLGREVWLRPATHDLGVAHACFSGEFDILAEHLPRDGRGLIVDAGGYVGTAALALSDLFPNATVVTIEPSDENAAVLRRNVAGNPRITALHAALVPSAGDGAAALVDRGQGEWAYRLGTAADGPPVAASAERVTLADLLRRSGFDRIMVLKMDIEGGERALLDEAGDWLPATDALFLELHPDVHPDVVEAYLRACQGRRNLDPGGEKRLSLAGTA